MSEPKRIEGWSTARVSSDPFRAPELDGIRLRGCVGEDHWVETSKVVSAEGRIVRTRSGSTYELGEADPKFVAWLKEQGRPFDPENPITVKK